MDELSKQQSNQAFSGAKPQEISLTDTGFYSIIDYTVEDADTQNELVIAFSEIQKKWVCFYPGYKSARFFASDDGKRVYNIVHWESESAYRNFEQTSDTKGRAAAIEKALEKLGGKAKLRMSESPRYKVAKIVTPAP